MRKRSRSTCVTLRPVSCPALKTSFVLPMNNEELIHRFESDTIPQDAFHHADHVRLAYAYLCGYPVIAALERFASALKRFAAAHGKTQLYHETITCAYVFLIRERMARCDCKDWDEFARQNPDLLQWKGGLLSRYYQEATLKSDLAREVFLLPDRCLSCQTTLLDVAADRR